MSVLQLSLQGDRRSFRPSGLHEKLSPSAHRSWSWPILRRDSRRAVQDNRTFASRSPHSTRAEWFVAPGLATRSISGFRFRANPDPAPVEQSFQSPSSSRICGMNPVRLTTAKPALTRITRWIAICSPQSTERPPRRTSCPNSSSLRLLFACSISGALDSAQSPRIARRRLC